VLAMFSEMGVNVVETEEPSEDGEEAREEADEEAESESGVSNRRRGGAGRGPEACRRQDQPSSAHGSPVQTARRRGGTGWRTSDRSMYCVSRRAKCAHIRRAVEDAGVFPTGQSGGRE
jgi:hypothetical protein